MGVEALTGSYLERLAELTGDVVSITVADGTDIACIALAPTRSLLRMDMRVGLRLPAYPTAMGRVLLSG
jgi:IclR family pca regulon transcriptional regulator